MAAAGDFKIIANAGVKADTISAGDIKSIFLEEKISLGDGTHVEPVLKKGGSGRDAFVEEFLGRSDDDLQMYYRTLVFSGKGSMPKTVRSDDEVVAYVAKTRGAIGYVAEATRADGVKTLSIIRGGNSSQRKLITRVEPEYPETLKRLNIGGTVRVQVTIAAKGNVENVELLGGNPILAEAAIAAVRQWVYTPSHSETTAEVTIPFDTH
jgi:TonB family protein